LWQEFGLQWFKNRTFELWRLPGEKESLWDKAERLLRLESGGEPVAAADRPRE
jgi:hypothetical protein